MSSQQNLPIDPDVHEWCSIDRVNRFEFELSNSAPILEETGLLKKVVYAWSRRELLQELCTSDELSDPQISDRSLTEWSRHAWGHRLETLYLSEKALLDKVTCSILRVSKQDLAFELYLRLKANETSFEQLSWKFGEGPERHQAGLYSNKFLSEIPSSLHPMLRKLKPGEVSKPHRLGKWYVIICLAELIPAQFDDDMERILLKRALNRWLNSVVDFLCSRLKLQDQLDATVE